MSFIHVLHSETYHTNRNLISEIYDNDGQQLWLNDKSICGYNIGSLTYKPLTTKFSVER